MQEAASQDLCPVGPSLWQEEPLLPTGRGRRAQLWLDGPTWSAGQGRALPLGLSWGTLLPSDSGAKLVGNKS